VLSFYLLSLAGFHHHFGQVQEDLSPLNVGMKYAEQNVKHPPMNIVGVSVTSYYTAPTWFCTHMVLVLLLGSAYVSSNL
jgi:hypothetical protein